MSGVVRSRIAARRDLVAIYRYLARDRNLRTASRFLGQAERTFQRLALMPGAGARYGHVDPAFADLRVAPVSRYKNYLNFYRPTPDGIEVLRVLHGARDVDSILGETFQPDDGDEADDDG